MFSLLRRHWDDLVSYDGGLSLLLMDGLLLVPLVMAAFFFPYEVAVGVGVALVVSLVTYEGWVLWHRRHDHHAHP